MLRVVMKSGVVIVGAALLLSACQSPTDSDDSIEVDDFVEHSVSPNPIDAVPSTDGKEFLVQQNELPDKHVPYDFKAVFSTTIRLNDTANDDDLDIEWPVKMTSISVNVQQASGGVVTPPTGSDTVHSDYLVRNNSGSEFSGANTSQSFTVELWYWLPSRLKEALVTISIGLVDDDGRTFTKTIEVKVNP